MAPTRKRVKVNTTTPTVVDFLVDLDQKNGKEIREEALSLYEAGNLDGLKRLLYAVDCELKKKARGDRGEWNKSKLYLESNIRLLENDRAKAKQSSSAPKRVGNIALGLDEELKHNIDLLAFQRRVDKLFRWYHLEPNNYYEGQMRRYVAPYFSVVQSSGTGKTRLLVALRDASNDTNIDYECMTVLCAKHDDTHKADDSDLLFFDKILRLPQPVDDKGEAKHRVVTLITNLLNGILAQANKNKLVLLFDEAQLLLYLDGAAFRCIRWWLREKRLKEVVAVFAGTSLNLLVNNATSCNSPPSSGFSRDVQTIYWNWAQKVPADGPRPTKLYAPFFRICTMGCYHKDAPALYHHDHSSSPVSDFERAAYFGRPLFACLQKRKELVAMGDTKETENDIVVTNSTLYAILSRMLLVNPSTTKATTTNSWKGNKTALYSILGSRVQMGIMTSLEISSDLVARAYAHLVHFHVDDSNKPAAVARITFMPDPVCAALAMGLMHENWTLTDGFDTLYGENPTFWSKQAMELLKSGLCLPENGNGGDIMAALYMLFCGDLLRHRIDKTLRSFSIPLVDWYTIMRGPKITKTRACHRLNPKQRGSVSMDVNFIQVCRRNYLRAHSWKTQKALELMYNSATAIYVDQGCHNQAIDLVAAIRVIRNGETIYHPLLVSVKCWTQASFEKSINQSIDNIKELLVEIRKGETEEVKVDTEEVKEDKEEEDIEDTDTEVEETTVVVPQKCPHVLGLLVLIGGKLQPSISTTTATALGEYSLDHLGNFPQEDAFRIISVPDNDAFGISDAAREMTMAHAMTKIFSSHSFVYGEEEEEDMENPSQLILRGGGGGGGRPQQRGLFKFVNSLFHGLSK